VRRFLKSSTNLRTIVVAVVVAVAAGSTGAIASQLITSKDIQNGTIKPVDLNKKLLKKINSGGKLAAAIPGQSGTAGTNGTNGANGAAGAAGEPGADGLNSGDPRVVTAGDLSGWLLAPYGDNSVVDGRGPDDGSDDGVLNFTQPPVSDLGENALEMKTENGKTVVAYIPFPGATTATQEDNPRLRELSTASYSSLIHAQPQAGLDINFKFEVLGAETGTGSGYTTVVFEPVYQPGNSEALNAWHRHYVAGAGKVWSSHGLVGAGAGKCTQGTPCTMSEFATFDPKAVVQTSKLVIGQNSGAAWPGFDGLVDDVRLGFDGEFTRYDLGG
jgi:hypothetical protein